MFQFQSTSLGICGQIVISRAIIAMQHLEIYLSTLSEEQCLKVLDIMAESGTQKVTICGRRTNSVSILRFFNQASERTRIVTMLVTNGSRLRTQSAKEMIPFLDWISISIDSSDPQINADLGRGSPLYHEYCLDVFEELSKFKHLRLKVNTVVTELNKNDDMRGLIRRLNPERWKVFRYYQSAARMMGRLRDC